jgi:hypothetical protein
MRTARLVTGTRKLSYSLAYCPVIFRMQTLSVSRMASSGMLHRVALVRTDVSEDLSAFFIRVTRIHELGTMLAASYS